ncbi:MAG: hypothetical protein ACK5NF_02935 [Bacilli bacterium]
MKKFLFYILFLSSIVGCNSNSTQNDMEKVFTDFETDSISSGYLLTYTSSQDITYDKFIVDFNTSDDFEQSLITKDSTTIFKCGKDNGYKLELDGVTFNQNPQLVKYSCKDNFLSTTINDISSVGFFDNTYDISYVFKDNYYIASGEFENGNKYKLKLKNDGKYLSYKDDKKEFTIELK